MPLPISPTIPIDLGDEEVTAKANTLLPWFTTGQQKALLDLLKSYHKEDIIPVLSQIQTILDTIADADVALAVDDKNDVTPLSFWTGTQSEYDAITIPDSHTLYIIK